MNLKSLGLRTDLIFPKYHGEIHDRGSYIVVKTSTNPDFFWGNLLIFETPPGANVRAAWERLFAEEFKGSGSQHKTFAWDCEEIGEVKQFEEAGYRFERSLVLRATAEQIVPPAHLSVNLRIRPVEGTDWESVIRVQSSTNPQYGSFYANQAQSYQKLIRAGMGQWFGAFLGEHLVGSLGLFRENEIGRFQLVTTDPAFQRQGICGTLVYRVSQHALSEMGLDELVMVADENYHAARIYESVGFKVVEKMYGVCHSGPLL